MLSRDSNSHEHSNDIPEYIQVTDVLDLHGFFPEQVPEVMDNFIGYAVEQGISRVRIIHGKGKSRLKFEVLQYLKNDDRVISYEDAPVHSGGWGATTVLLQKDQP